jgi:hypothetical protein
MDNSINEVVEKIIRDSQTEPTISPNWVADRAYAELDPSKLSPFRVALLARFALRQLARQILAKRFQPDDPQEMLPNVDCPQLQQRYPLKPSKDQEPTYIKLELLKEEDMLYNVERLRAEAANEDQQADQLGQWWIERHSGE